VRERFLPATDRCQHLRASALDLGWLDRVDPSRGVFVSAQGLLMYFTEAEVRALLVAIVERFPGVELMFDVIPPWFSRKTVAGWDVTEGYRAPAHAMGDQVQRPVERAAAVATLDQARGYAFVRVRPRPEEGAPGSDVAHPEAERPPAGHCARVRLSPRGTPDDPGPGDVAPRSRSRSPCRGRN